MGPMLATGTLLAGLQCMSAIVQKTVALLFFAIVCYRMIVPRVTSLTLGNPVIVMSVKTILKHMGKSMYITLIHSELGDTNTTKQNKRKLCLYLARCIFYIQSTVSW